MCLKNRLRHTESKKELHIVICLLSFDPAYIATIMIKLDFIFFISFMFSLNCLIALRCKIYTNLDFLFSNHIHCNLKFPYLFTILLASYEYLIILNTLLNSSDYTVDVTTSTTDNHASADNYATSTNNEASADHITTATYTTASSDK